MSAKVPYKIVEYLATSFNCPFCNAFSAQSWKSVSFFSGNLNNLENTMVCFCAHCKIFSIWYNEKMIYPDFFNIEPPNDDLDNAVKEDYQEAASILQKSPRGAAALLRLAIQKLCIQLGGKGENLNQDIGELVKGGLSQKVQQSLDALRVIGNEAVHPGQLDLKDDIVTATSLFKLINFIAEKMITEPNEVGAIYDLIPDAKKKQIEERDKTN